ncbi:MAG: DUF2231 domain-containing protein [Desulfosalsimonadaceae bacterium]
MTEFVFKILTNIGFNHPLHPIATHLPMGMVMGLFLFGMASYLFKNQELAKTAYHCAILGFLGLFPTILFGYMDWLHSYSGQWLMLIKIKIVLACVLMVLLAGFAVIGRKESTTPALRLVFYILCMMAATGLGYCGGTLVYG